jgi:hypothetical protein
MPPSRQGGPSQGGTARASIIYLLTWLDLLLQLCRVQRGLLAQTTILRGDSPRTLWGASCCLAAVSFLSPFGRPLGAGGGGGSRFQAGARVLTAPARIRDGTQGIANPKGCSFNCSPWGRVSGLGRGRFLFRATAAR